MCWSVHDLIIDISAAECNVCFQPTCHDFQVLRQRFLLYNLYFMFIVHVCLYFTGLSISCILLITCWERADLLALLCMMFCHFPIWCLGSGVSLNVSIPDLCLLYFVRICMCQVGICT